MKASQACSEMMQQYGFFVFGDLGPALEPGHIAPITFLDEGLDVECKVIGPASLQDVNILLALGGRTRLDQSEYTFYRAVIE